MLDFKNKSNVLSNADSDNNTNLRNKLKNKINREMTAKTARTASFFSLASVLGACNFGGGSDTVAPLNISAIKGPLSGALAFIDRDGDGAYDEGEEFGVTGSTGATTITPNSTVSATDKLVITSISAGQTIGGTTYTTATTDTNTGGTVADLVLKAPGNSTVVTPVTTIVAETGLSESAVKEVLGLPAEMDVLNFNPFKADLTDAEKNVALEAEKVALKVYTTVSTIQASAKSAGLDMTKAFETAIEAVADVVKTQSAAGAKADLADSTIIDQVVAKTETVLTTKLEAAGFDAATVTAAVTANKAVLATAKSQIKTVNDAADAITTFDATELGAIAKLAVKSGEEAAAAVTAEKANPGSGAASFTMKTADAVAKAKETAKAEVIAATDATETTTTTSTTSTTAATPFKMSTSTTTVDWAITKSATGAGSQAITANDSTDATYQVSGGVMTINLGQKFSLATVKDLLNNDADLTFALSLASLPSNDDTTANTTTVTITEGADGTISSGEGQIKASAQSTYTAASSTHTDFTFVEGEPIAITYTPRSGNSDVAVNITNPTENTYSVGNDGNFNDKGGRAVMEVMATKFFNKLDDNSSNWTKTNIMNNFVTANTPAVHLSMGIADLGFYVGSTKITAIETTLNIADNPTTGGVVSGTARTGSKLTATTIGDLDAINGTVTTQWEISANGTSGWSNATGTGNDGYEYTIANGDATKYLRFTASYTDKQGNAYTGADKYVSAATAQVQTNNSPTGSVTVTGNAYVGQTLTASNNIADADGLGTISYKWQKATDGTTFSDISGATSSTYTITAADSANKTTKIKAVASYTDTLGTAETVASSPTGNLVKPVLYAAKIGTATTSNVEIGFYIDDEVLTGDQLNMKNVEFKITPSETWATNFEKITDGFKAGVSKSESYFWDGPNSNSVTAGEFAATADWNGKAQTGWTSSFNPKTGSSNLDGSSGKATLTLAGTHAGVTLGDTGEFADLSVADYKLFSIYGNPVDNKVTGSTKVTFTMEAASLYDHINSSNATVNLDSAVAFLVDPYTFDIII